MNAARSANETAIMKLFLEPFDLSCVDGDGNTALHIAAMNGHQHVCRMLIVLASPTCLWEIKNKAGLTAEDLALDEKIREDLLLLRKGQQRKEDERTRWNDDIISETTEWKPNGKVLLALDGGGVKSLVLTQ
ncbi:ankyrin repeat protein, partial [Ostertagia ostertagi]